MTLHSSDHRLSRRTWLLIGDAALLWALVSTVETMARASYFNSRASFGAVFLSKLPLALTLAMVTPGILYLSRRFPLLGSPRRGRWDIHLAACLALVALIDLISCIQTTVSTGIPFDLGPWPHYLSRVLGLWLVPVGLLYWLITLVDHGVRHYLQAREQTEAAARMAAQATQARLEALKLQLHPHFLFNALNSVGALVRTGRSADAVQVTARLGGLLRRVLDDAPVQEVRLREELAFVEDYLSIEMIRFSDRLRVHYDIAPDTSDALVPHLLLQPLVENALHHGLQSRAEGGLLTIAARRENGRLELTVKDNGVGLTEAAERSEGRVGLANARARLEELYGENQSLTVERANGSGAEVRVRLPFRATAENAP